MLFDRTISRVCALRIYWIFMSNDSDHAIVARFAKEIEAERVLCLTATATPKVADDICAAFDIDTSEGIFRTTTYRPNLHLIAKSFTSDRAKELHLIDFFQTHRGPSIVYVQTHDQTELVCGILKNAGFDAHSYHAGMASELRTAVQDKFMSSNEIIVRVITSGSILHLPLLMSAPLYRLSPQLLSGWVLTRPISETSSITRYRKA